MKWLSSTGIMACLAGCATPQMNGLDSIAITQRPSYGVCAGYCPNMDIVVREDGQATLSKHRFEGADEISHMQLTPRQTARFFRILSGYRPKLRQAGPAACEFWNNTDPMVMRVFPRRVIWSDADGSSFQLRSCGGPESLREAIRKALWSIGLYVGGEPRR